MQSLGREDSLEKGMAIHSSILTWRILWTEEPGGLLSIGSQRVGHDWSDLAYEQRGQNKDSYLLFLEGNQSCICVRERETEKEREWCVCVCVRVWKRWLRERERERESPEQSWVSLNTTLWWGWKKVYWEPGIERTWGTAPTALKPSSGTKENQTFPPAWKTRCGVSECAGGQQRPGSGQAGLPKPGPWRPQMPTREASRSSKYKMGSGIPQLSTDQGGDQSKCLQKMSVDPLDTERAMRHPQEEQNTNRQ